MPNEKYLDYAGLQYYHEKLNLDLASMLMTDNDLDTVLLDELNIVPPLPETWTESTNGTLNLALGDAFSYWPESAGTKTISITNGTTAEISKFFLKLTDAGNFFVEWGSNIQWKNGSEPEWQAFHEDIIFFKSNDNGSTWIAQVVQTNEITPYWKITVDIATKDYGCGRYTNGQMTDFGHDVYLLFGAMPGGPTIDWGDGTIETNPTDYTMFSHTYTSDGIYHIKIEYDDFEHVYAYNIISSELGYIWFYQRNIISIDSPLPHLAGSWQGTSTSKETYDNDFEGIFGEYDGLKSIPEKLFYNNPNITSLRDAFSGCPLNDFTLYISSPNIQTPLTYDNRITFCTTQTGGYYVSNDCDYSINWYPDETTHDRNSTIYAPCGSNTFKSFSSIASSHGLTIRGIPNNNTFVYTVTTDSDKKSAIPFTLYNIPNTTLCVDWGDGTTSSLTSSNYSEYDTMSSVHTYTSAGTYTIKVNCNNWNNIYLLQADLSPFGSFEVTNNYIKTEESYVLTRDNGPMVPIYYWRSTINAINTALPALKGTQTYIADPQDYEDYISETCNNQIILQECAFETIPSNLFENNLSSTSFSYCFYDCCNLVSIPTELFKQCTTVTNFNNCFKGCTYLDNFTLEIGSSSVSNASDFVTEKTGTTRTINVPSGSTTQTTFNNVASSLGLTIVGV